ncbi:hypothetical protein BGX38DRAFT_1189847 [Terfezia claveryi]|nr:hypothetical protein BGX38DRAFT_1189847 [Terfezia claveryi]
MFGVHHVPTRLGHHQDRRVLQPISVSDANILQHLPGTWKSNPSTPRAKAKQRPGPKPKSLENRVYKIWEPIQKVKRSYSREKKIEVLMILIHHRLPQDGDENLEVDDENDGIEYRCLTQTEIVDQKIGSRHQPNASWLCLWPQFI